MYLLAILSFIVALEIVQLRQYARIPFASLIISESSKYGIPSSLALAQVKHESGFNPNAIGLRGERGLMQIRPPALNDVNRELGTSFSFDDLFSPTVNVKVGFKYLDMQREKFGTLYNGYIAYNSGGITSLKGKQYAETIFSISKEF